MNSPQVSIITALFNRLDLTKSFLVSLEANPPSVPWEMIWIDDGSTDGTREWLKDLSSLSHRIILNESNLGYAANNNLGARLATGEVLVFLNNDLVLTRGWCAPLYGKLLSEPNIGVIGNVQIQPNTGLIDHAGVFFDLVGCPGHRHKNRAISVLAEDGVYSTAVTAACWLVRKQVFFSIGGFDELYRNGAEDVDLCLRLGQQGYRHWVDYRSVIYHHVSSSPGRKKHDLLNQALFLHKWGELTSKQGQLDWPKAYLARLMRTPRHFNLVKFIDALLRLLKLRRWDSAWAKQRRAKLISDGLSNRLS